jgi:hypothetical protein
MRHKQQPLVLVGRPFAPADSWWATTPPDGFTRFVQDTQLERMRTSKFSLLEPHTPRKAPPLPTPSQDEYACMRAGR